MKTIKVGLTGGIGTGKSTVARIFETIGIPVYYADAAAKRLMQTDRRVKEELSRLFGSNVYAANGELKRAWLADKVFNNDSMLAELNAVIHPAVRRDAEIWFNSQSGAYAIEEAAILIESGAYQAVDVIIVVTAPRELCISRVMQRDNVNKDKVLQRMDNQLSMEERLSYADYRIVNDGNQFLIPQVLHIDNQLKYNFNSNF